MFTGNLFVECSTEGGWQAAFTKLKTYETKTNKFLENDTLCYTTNETTLQKVM